MIFSIKNFTTSILVTISQKYFSGSNIPVLIVANKIDLGTVRQDYFVQPETFCKENNLPAPIEFSSIRPKKDLFVKLTTMAAFPLVLIFILITIAQVIRSLIIV